jgi:uncharacterized RDD family membrane protein YckC
MTRQLSSALAICVTTMALWSNGGTSVHAQARTRSVPTNVERVALPIAATTMNAQTFERFHFSRPIFRIWQDFTLPAGDEVRQIVMVLGSTTIEGTVHGDVFAWFGNVTLGPTAVVDGAVGIVAGNLVVEPGATLSRDLVMVGGAVSAPAAFTPGGDHFVIGTPVLGQRLRQLAAWATRGPLLGRIIVPDLGWVWAVLGIVFVFSLLFNQIFHEPVRASADVVLQKPLSVLLMGMLLVIVIGPALVILAASVVGLLVVPFALCALFVGWSIGKIGVTRAIGIRVLPQTADSRPQALRSFVIGFAILIAAYMVPLLGLTVWALVGLFGLGAAGLTFVERRRRTIPPGRAADAPHDRARNVGAAEVLGAPAEIAADEPLAEVVIPAAPPPIEPPPSGATALLPHAAFFDRAAAFALDCVLIAIAVQLLSRRGDDGFYFLVLLAYHIAFWIWKGTTLGGIVCNLRVIRTTGEPLRPIDAVVRGLSSLFSIAALGIGCLWMLRDPARQTWHDKIAGTYVVKVPKDWPLA